MLARDLLRSAPDRVRSALADRGQSPDALGAWLELDGARRTALQEVESLKQRRNEASKQIGRLKGSGADADAAIAEVAAVKERIAALEARLDGLDGELAAIELALPNLPHDSVPRGADESANRVERRVGEPPRFGFEPRAH